MFVLVLFILLCTEYIMCQVWNYTQAIHCTCTSVAPGLSAPFKSVPLILRCPLQNERCWRIPPSEQQRVAGQQFLPLTIVVVVVVVVVVVTGPLNSCGWICGLPEWRQCGQ